MEFKCKMCGGNLHVDGNSTIATCEYCGTTQTIPHIDSEKKARLFSRANDYRLAFEFDKACNAYESIIAEDPNEAEAYWGLLLSTYGVEYVEDPSSHKRIPTCHRTLIESVTSNFNFQKACELADAENKLMYQDEAEALDSLQKKILSVLPNEAPYDVFICYKESGENGERTEDSVLAQDIYEELTSRGMRVFFSRISLEDKIGKDYEPYIFSALRSAKVMLLVSTKNEHCNAVWVKNEWKRYIEFMKSDKEKTLVPVIKGMAPYELPDELQRLQVQDMNKLGSMQDLSRGVRKILNWPEYNNSVNFSERYKEQLSPEELRQRSIKRNKTVFSFLAAFFIFFDCIAFSSFDLVSYGVKTITIDNAGSYVGRTLASIMWLLSIAVFILVGIAIIINIAKGMKSKLSNIIYLIFTIGGSAALFAIKLLNLRPLAGLLIHFYALVILCLVSTFFCLKDKKFALVITVLLIAALSIAPLFINKSQSNVRDSSVPQLMIITDYINIRKEPNPESSALGRVMDGEIYTILDDFEDEKGYTWYKIQTEFNIVGYIIANDMQKDGNHEAYITLLQ